MTETFTIPTPLPAMGRHIADPRLISPKAQEIADPLLKLPIVQELTSLPVSTLYAWVKQGRFPSPVKLGVRSVAWRLSDVQSWLDSRVPARGA